MTADELRKVIAVTLQALSDNHGNRITAALAAGIGLQVEQTLAKEVSDSPKEEKEATPADPS